MQNTKNSSAKKNCWLLRKALMNRAPPDNCNAFHTKWQRSTVSRICYSTSGKRIYVNFGSVAEQSKRGSIWNHISNNLFKNAALLTFYFGEMFWSDTQYGILQNRKKITINDTEYIARCSDGRFAKKCSVQCALCIYHVPDQNSRRE